jgi:hypothetical protein
LENTILGLYQVIKNKLKILGSTIGGSYTKPLIPMFLFKSFQIQINLNPYAFFVPILDMNITDINSEIKNNVDLDESIFEDKNDDVEIQNFVDDGIPTFFKNAIKNLSFGLTICKTKQENNTENLLYSYIQIYNNQNESYIKETYKVDINMYINKIRSIDDSNFINKTFLNFLIKYQFYIDNKYENKNEIFTDIESYFKYITTNSNLIGLPLLYIMSTIIMTKITVVTEFGDKFKTFLVFDKIVSDENRDAKFFVLLKENKIYFLGNNIASTPATHVETILSKYEDVVDMEYNFYSNIDNFNQNIFIANWIKTLFPINPQLQINKDAKYTLLKNLENMSGISNVKVFNSIAKVKNEENYSVNSKVNEMKFNPITSESLSEETNEFLKKIRSLLGINEGENENIIGNLDNIFGTPLNKTLSTIEINNDNYIVSNLIECQKYMLGIFPLYFANIYYNKDDEFIAKIKELTDKYDEDAKILIKTIKKEANLVKKFVELDKKSINYAAEMIIKHFNINTIYKKIRSVDMELIEKTAWQYSTFILYFINMESDQNFGNPFTTSVFKKKSKYDFKGDTKDIITFNKGSNNLEIGGVIVSIINTDYIICINNQDHACKIGTLKKIDNDELYEKTLECEYTDVKYENLQSQKTLISETNKLFEDFKKANKNMNLNQKRLYEGIRDLFVLINEKKKLDSNSGLIYKKIYYENILIFNFLFDSYLGFQNSFDNFCISLIQKNLFENICNTFNAFHSFENIKKNLNKSSFYKIDIFNLLCEGDPCSFVDGLIDMISNSAFEKNLVKKI